MHLLNSVLINIVTYLPYLPYASSVRLVSSLPVQYFTEVRVISLHSVLQFIFATGEITFYQQPQNGDLSNA